MTEDEKGRYKTEAHLCLAFGSHATSVRRLLDAYLHLHPDIAIKALKDRNENGVRFINDPVFAKQLIKDAMVWWKNECAAIAMLID
jgi:hypothetical protein